MYESIKNLQSRTEKIIQSATGKDKSWLGEGFVLPSRHGWACNDQASHTINPYSQLQLRESH